MELPRRLPKPLHEQLRRQGKEALEQIRGWPERMTRNLPDDWDTGKA